MLKSWYPTQRKERVSIPKKKKSPWIFLAFCFRVCAVLLGHKSRSRLRNRRNRAENSIVKTSITVWRVQVAAISLALNHQAVLWWLGPIKRTWGMGYTIWVHISDLVGFPDSSAGKESTCNAGDPCLIPGWGRSTGEEIGYPLQYSWASLMVQLVKNPLAMWQTRVQSLGWEDPLEKGMATHCSILAWRIPWTV